MPEENEKHSVKVVSWQIFIWSIGIILIVLGVGFNMIGGLDKKVETSASEINGLKVDMSEVKTNVVWIRQALERNEAQINPSKK